MVNIVYNVLWLCVLFVTAASGRVIVYDSQYQLRGPAQNASGHCRGVHSGVPWSPGFGPELESFF